MQHNAAFHLGLHCLPKYPFRGFHYTCTDPESFVREGGPTLTFSYYFVFLIDKGREDLNTSISGSSSASQRNAKWRFAGVPMMAQH